jgi:uncharacterized delta-60 repeat protein
MVKHSIFVSLILIPGACFTQSGVLDPTYAGDGISVLQPGDLHDIAYDIIALEDNRSMICGTARQNGIMRAFIARLLPDGSVDTDFGTDAGYTFFSAGVNATGKVSAARDADGSFVVVWTAWPNDFDAVVGVARVDNEGLPVSGFGTNGVVTHEIGLSDSFASCLALPGNGHIIVGGSMVGPDAGFDRDAFILRLLPDGNLDPQFGDGGIAVNEQHPEDDRLRDVCILPDGRVIGCGSADVGPDDKTLLYMVNGDGSAASNFGSSGFLLPAIGPSTHEANALVALDFEVCITGASGGGANSDVYISLIQLAGGSFAPDFGTGGVVTLDVAQLDAAYAIERYGNGDYVISGTTGSGGFKAPRDFLVARFTASGDPVMSFGTTGSVTTSIGAAFDDAYAVAIQPDGKILAAGRTRGANDDLAVTRYTVDWTLGTQDSATKSFSVFPNPVEDGWVKLRFEDAGARHARLFDAAGRLAKDFGILLDADAQPMSLQGVAPGCYRLELRSETMVSSSAIVVR